MLSQMHRELKAKRRRNRRLTAEEWHRSSLIAFYRARHEYGDHRKRAATAKQPKARKRRKANDSVAVNLSEAMERAAVEKSPPSLPPPQTPSPLRRADSFETVPTSNKRSSRATFAGISLRRRQQQQQKRPSVVQWQIPPAQYWAVLEGLGPLTSENDPATYLQDLVIHGNKKRIPRYARLYELPWEIMPGQWTAQWHGHAHRTRGLFLPDGSSSTRVLLRHEAYTTMGPLLDKPAYHQRIMLNPAVRRQEDMARQKVAVEDGDVFVASLTLVSFAGFDSADQCQKTARSFSKALLKQVYRKGWSHPPPDMFPVPSFECMLDKDDRTLDLEGSGGVGLLGCFVDAFASQDPSMDYKVIILQEEITKQIVAVDSKWYIEWWRMCCVYDIVSNPFFFMRNVQSCILPGGIYRMPRRVPLRRPRANAFTRLFSAQRT